MVWNWWGALSGRGEQARHDAVRALAICEDGGVGDFDSPTPWRAWPGPKRFEGDFAAGPWYGADAERSAAG